jgi:hypothetical protein
MKPNIYESADKRGLTQMKTDLAICAFDFYQRLTAVKKVFK